MDLVKSLNLLDFLLSKKDGESLTKVPVNMIKQILHYLLNSAIFR